MATTSDNLPRGANFAGSGPSGGREGTKTPQGPAANAGGPNEVTHAARGRGPASLIFPTIPPTHTRPLVHDPYLPCEVPRQRVGSTQIPPLTGYEPKSIETEAIKPEDLEPRRTELDRNLGQIRIKDRKDLREITTKILSSEIWMNFRDVLHPVTDAFRL